MTSDTPRSLFIGGPVHGQLTAVKQDPYAVPVAYPAEPDWAEAGTAMAAKTPQLETVMYTRRVVQLLGRDLVIYVDPSTNLATNDGVRTLFEAILTPEARGAIRPTMKEQLYGTW